jgi:hypothetical protein
MKQHVFEEDFINAFITHPSRSEQFSRDALSRIYQYLVEVEEATGEELTLDVTAVYCEFTENTIDGAGYDNNVEREGDDDEAYRKRVVARIQERTQVVWADVDSNTIVYMNF